MAKPFIKWAGGKTKLIPQIDSLMSERLSRNKEFVYVEPFVGGGSVLFHLLDSYSNLKYAVINDANEQLMNCYRVIADNEKYNKFKTLAFKIQEDYNKDPMKQEKYNLMRFQYNHWIKGELWMDDIDVWGAVAFMFINKCGFNGLYRVNQKGECNVPWGQKDYLKMFNIDELDRCHVLLNEKVVIMCGDYHNTDIIVDVEKFHKDNDVMFYLDPPCKPIGESTSFVSYTKDVFSDENQVELKQFCDKINECGCKFIQSSPKIGDFFDNLYSEYNINAVSAKLNINSNGSKRGNIDEVLIYN